MSDRVSTEQSSDSTIGTKSYTYDADGQMQGMTQTQGGTSTRYGMGYDTRGNVSQLLNETGKAKATYGYTPYGGQIDGTTQGDTDKTKPLNAYRFQGKRFDSGSGNLQMGARMFGPNTGRFLQPDQYMGAFDQFCLYSGAVWTRPPSQA